MRLHARAAIAIAAAVSFVVAQGTPLACGQERDTTRGDQMLAEYFAIETAKLQDGCLEDVKSLDDWQAKQGEYRRQLHEMLGLDPLPEKTDLRPEITGRVEHDEFFVEKLHFQSRPGLYVTGNLYVPKKIDQPLPAILYVCGHGGVKNKEGIPLGNKTHYQHHGGWFARNGYVCLTIDTLQLGEIEGIHHGTHKYGMWWWLNRGYTPAGVEAWNCIRALDYLETRPEVDKARFGVTGRSGGGAYSWWVAALDERIKCAVPVAGITDLQNHVVDGCVEGHCDCMYMVNTYRWDYPQVAALIAPRPLLISNTDTDGIFPLDGVYRTFEHVRRIYRLYDAAEKGTSAKVALNITAGGHKDTQELQVHAFRWFDQHLKAEDKLVQSPAEKFFDPQDLKVFATLPTDEKNTQIQETFVAAAEPPPVPAGKDEWETLRDRLRITLLDKSFRAWPQTGEPLDVQEAFAVDRDGVHFAAYDFTSQAGIRLRLYVMHRAGLTKPEINVLNVLDEEAWQKWLADVRPAFEAELKDEQLPEASKEGWAETRKMFETFPWVMTHICPRGVGPTAFDQSEKKQIQNRRRFYLLGQSLDGLQTWDIRRAIQACRGIESLAPTPLWLQSHRTMAGNTLYAAIFEPEIKRVDLYDLPTSHRDGPIYFNVQKFMETPQAVAIVAEKTKVVLYQDETTGWEFPQQVAQKLGWDAKQIQLRKKPPKKAD